MTLENDAGRIGRRMVAEGLVGGNFGNMSVREHSGFSITGRGAFLDDPGTLVFVPDGGPVPPSASSECRVHRDIYSRHSFGAIVHAHPVHAIALSFDLAAIMPEDAEGRLFCPRIPVVGGEPGTAELAERIARAMTDSPVVIARGHGTFAGGATLEEAYLLTSIAEHGCRILWLRRAAGLNGSSGPKTS